MRVQRFGFGRQEPGRPGVGAVVTALMVLGTVLLAVPLAQAQVATGKGRLNGIVMQADGTPIEGATIVLTHVDTGQSWELTTNSSGRWLKGNMGRGNWNVDITAPGYLPAFVRVRVQEINRSKPVQTYLEPGEIAGEAVEAALFGGELGKRVDAGNTIYVAGDFQGALSEFEAIIAEYSAKENPNPNLYLVHVNAGNAAFELNDYAKAAEHFDAALAADSANEDARLGKAKIFMMERKLDEALAQLDQIDLSKISDPIVFYNIGNLLFNQGQSAEAQKYFELALNLNLDFADAHMQLALCFVQQGMMEEAKSHLHSVIELDPESQNAALAQDFLDTIG